MDQNDKDLLSTFAASREAKNFVIAYGGDGTLLKVASEVGMKKGIIPIRDYGRCAKHSNLLEEICGNCSIKNGLKYTKHNFLNAYVNGVNLRKNPISEIVVKNADPTEALRFTVVINGKKYMSQCIADGFIFASVLGAHGYFKSVSRTLFVDPDSIGLAFLSPTYSICNLVLRNTDKLKIVLERDANAVVSFDKAFSAMEMSKDTEIELEQSCDGIALYGYDIFCCPECRKLRNSTAVNDQWL